MNILISVLWIIVGFILLIKGADFLVDGASNIAKKFHIPEIIIGLTIVSIGTSMPELLVSLTSATEGYADMAIGNIIGSNICNLLLILGLSTMIMPVEFQKQTKLIEIPMSILLTFIFFLICNSRNDVSRIDGIVLIVLFILFLIYTIYMGMKADYKEEGEEEKISIIKSIVFLFGGIVGLKIGGDLVVDHAVIVAEHFKISEQIISLTVLAIGTSLPELVTSVTAAIKGNSDIAIGNIIGSNIFNMLLIIGVSSVISPITYNVAYNIQLYILLGSLALLFIFPFIKPKNKMSRGNGLLYFLGYIGYLILLFIM